MTPSVKRQKIKVYNDAFCRIDVWLQQNFPDCSRTAFSRLIKEGFISVNRVSVRKPSREIHPDDVVEIRWPVDIGPSPLPEYLPLDIVFQDEHLLVINKRAGVTVHPVSLFQKGTLVNGLLYSGIPLSHYGAPFRPGIVHRLDRDTSGVMMVAKTDRAYLELVRMFKHREIEKTYLALVEGHWEGTGEVNAPIVRSRIHPCQMEVTPIGGKPALTILAPVITGDHYSLLLAYPRTGRTHQIRVHLSSCGTPIAGDTRYGARPVPDLISRQALHAFILSFSHPITGHHLTCAAALPADFRTALDKLGM